ncbi:Hypothetical protein PHPALM_11349 [Phytophthora palmivora]|uniref:Transmembrane protein n=1 Tax=Phytophthora palmivora TaxID=4796 RepID=A0A2P4Y2I6_9STRA|nr:Hypothetical protein PHPALM_11349 [Phytophthora palmivora]
MLSLRFLSAPNHRPTAWFCFKKLFRRTILYFVVVLSFTCGFSRLLAYVSSELPEILVYKFECYIVNFSLLAYFTAIAITTKEIFYRETCQGRDRFLKTARIQKPATVLIDPKTHSESRTPSRSYRTQKFWNEYVKNLPKGAPPIVATAFVHVLSQQKVVNHGSVVLYCFVMGSIMCKLAIQEGAKHYVLNKRIRSIRVMCALVGVPTVLIDTQTRIILLGSNSTKIAAVGALGMAFVEICFRVGKAMLVVWSIRRRERKVHPQVPISICSKNNDSDKRRGSRQSSSFLLSMVELSSVVTSEDFELWRRQVQAFHTAELNADMYAEYIAIGCSASILFFYGDHPHYSLLRETKRTEAKADVTIWYTSQMYMLAFQVAVEILVDYVSLVLEMKIGIEFENIQRLGAFLAVLFMVAAVMNINISIGVYLNQSRNELIVANALWATITFCVVMLIARLPSMLSLQFIETPDSKPTVWFCLKKLFRGTLVYFFATLVGMLACSAFIAYLVSIKPSLFKYKFDCYVGTLSTHGFFTGITLTAKRIYYRETCQGRKRLLLGQEAEADANQSRRKAISFRSAYSVRSFKFWRAYIKEFPKSMPAALAGVFVHILSQQRIMERGPTILTCFVVASTVFKLTIQESTKHYILKKRIRNIKFMCAAVALPTVLIDTQTRIILLGSKSTGLVAMGTLGMALMEICLRVLKATMIVKIIRKREATVFKSKMQTLSRPSVSSVRISSVSSPSPVRVDFELWRKRLHSYHIAEVNADTYAEYIAIGCSASILFFFGDHPHYSLLSQSDSVDHGRQRSMQLKILIFQVWIEIVVDFVSTLLEMMAGIDYDLIKNLGPFLTVLFVVTAVLNINISVGIYLS